MLIVMYNTAAGFERSPAARLTAWAVDTKSLFNNVQEGNILEFQNNEINATLF